MGFWIFMLAMDLLIPATMVGFGAYFRKKAPREINGVFGYRTPRSMVSREAWAHAHRLCGVLWLWGGIALFPLTMVAFLPLLGGSEETVGGWGAVICFVQILLMMVTIIPIEISLHRHFYPNGDRRVDARRPHDRSHK